MGGCAFNGSFNLFKHYRGNINCSSLPERIKMRAEILKDMLPFAKAGDIYIIDEDGSLEFHLRGITCHIHSKAVDLLRGGQWLRFLDD